MSETRISTQMVSRRIGRNELRVLDVCRDYVRMQKAYASQPRDGKLAGLYAQKLMSSPGRQDGLYWSVGNEETPSPLGDLVAQAVVEGYDVKKDPSQPLWGYHYRILTAQGAAAKGGARSYIVNGEMSGGFGLIAYPADYGQGGIMTFVVNQDGIVYQKDLGEDTLKVAPTLNDYNPDGTVDRSEGTSVVDGEICDLLQSMRREIIKTASRESVRAR